MTMLNGLLKGKVKVFIIITPVIIIVSVLGWFLLNYLKSGDGMEIEGYVVEKEQKRILVAENMSFEEYQEIEDQSLTQLMEQEVELIYLEYKGLSIDEGDRVKVWVTGVDSSYPAQADPNKIVKE